MKKQFWLYATILLLQFVGLSLSAQNADGYYLLKNGKINSARKYFQAELNKNQKSPKACFDLGNFYLKINNVDSAQIYFKKGLEVDPTDAFCQLGTAAVFAIKGNAYEAEKIQRALAIDKTKKIEYVLILLDAWIKSSNVPEGMIDALLTRAKEINKSNPDIYISKANLSIKNQKYGDAANDYEMALYYDSTNVDANTRLGDIYAAVKNRELATKAYAKALNKDSAYLPALKGLGELYYDRGNYPKAAFLYAKYLANAEVTSKDQLKYGTILYFNKDYSNSLSILNKIQGEDNFVIKRLMAYNQFELKDYPTSLNTIKQLFSSVKDSSKIVSLDYEYYGKILGKNGMDSLAIENLKTAIQKDSSKTYLYENIGQSYEKQKKYILAKNSYERLIKSKKNPLTTDYFMLGKVNYFAGANCSDSIQRRKLLLEADSIMNIVVTQNATSHFGYFWRARVNSQIDPETTKGLAKPYYEKVIEICSIDPTKFKKELIESYQYLGYYYFINKDNNTSKSFWQKVLDIDPNDAKAKDAMKGIK